MNKLIYLLILVLFGSLIAQNKQLSLAAIFNSHDFDLESIDEIRWLPDNSGFTFLKKKADSSLQQIYKHDFKSGQESLLIDGQNLRLSAESTPMIISDYKWIDKGKRVLFTVNEKTIWRHSRKAQYFIYDLNTKMNFSLIKGDPFVSNVKISPDKNRVGYIQNNNLYIYDIAKSVSKQLTSDGNDEIINGQFDWVYEEEFAISDGWQWSEDGKKIAFWRFDQSNVPTFSWINFEPLNGEVETIRYPKAGQSNSEVKIGVVDVNSGETVWMDLGEEKDIYIPRVNWIDNRHLAIQKLNRLQNKLEMLAADVSSGKAKVVFAETDPAWINVNNNLSFPDNDRFTWTSERSGFNHIYRGSIKSGSLIQVTDGPWEVSEIYGSDGKKIFFGANKESITDKNIYSINLDGSDLTLITKEKGRHSAIFSDNFEYFIDKWSSSTTPTRFELYDSDGKKIRTLTKNDISALADYSIPHPEFFNITTTDGTELSAWIYKPNNFDPLKKYPVLVYGYGGPASQIVTNEWGTTKRAAQRRLWHGMLAEQGYLVFSVENRGTGGKGKAFKNLAYRDLGKYVVNDQIEGAKYLAKLPYVDKNRIGIWGWSGGGFLTLHCMLRAADYFKMGIAVAPVSDFRLYDTIWSERYMGLPQENKDGYEAANAMNYIDGLKGKLMIVHGSADDNVHFQNTMKIVEKMQQKPVQFDLMVYPGLNHSINKGNSSWHVYTLMTRYIKENL